MQEYKAWAQVNWHGRDYCLRLAMPSAGDYDSFVPSAGAVRNFRWQLTGRIPDLDDQYFGGEVRLMGDGSAPGSNDVELTHGRYVPVFMESKNRDVRKAAFEAMYALQRSGGSETPTVATATMWPLPRSRIESSNPRSSRTGPR